MEPMSLIGVQRLPCAQIQSENWGVRKLLILLEFPLLPFSSVQVY
jgi:hypothetical protein